MLVPRGGHSHTGEHSGGVFPNHSRQHGASPMEAYERLKRLIEEVADDIAKAEGGNKAAGTRVRKIMQEVKQTAQEVRTSILESRTES